jgi:DNA-binding response OmpR family regulator
MRPLGGHLLVVEDDTEMRDLLKKVLEKEGYRVSVAEDGAEALSMLGGGAYDLVVTDMLMPVKNGLDLLQDVHRSRPTLPVIVVTAFGDWASYSRAVEMGAAAFIKKPLRMSELVTTVQTTLSRHGTPGCS